MHWEIWDARSRSFVADFGSEAESLGAVRDMRESYGVSVLDSLIVVAMYDEGEPRDIELPPALEGPELRARLDESALPLATNEVSRAVHARIRTWLAEEGWSIEDVDDPLASFNVMVALKSGNRVNIFQRHAHLDHVTVALHVVFRDTDPAVMGGAPVQDEQAMLWEIERDVSVMGLDFAIVGVSPIQARYAAYLYFDGLSKDALIQKVLLVLRAVKHSGQVITRRLRDVGARASTPGGAAPGSSMTDLAQGDDAGLTRAVPDNVVGFPGFQRLTGTG